MSRLQAIDMLKLFESTCLYIEYAWHESFAWYAVILQLILIIS